MCSDFALEYKKKNCSICTTVATRCTAKACILIYDAYSPTWGYDDERKLGQERRLKIQRLSSDICFIPTLGLFPFQNASRVNRGGASPDSRSFAKRSQHGTSCEFRNKET